MKFMSTLGYNVHDFVLMLMVFLPTAMRVIKLMHMSLFLPLDMIIGKCITYLDGRT